MNIYRDEKGFSLIEVIISIAILGILIIPICALMTFNSKLNAKSRNQILATNLAEGEIEELKFSETVKIGKSTVYKDGFTIDSFIESVNLIEDNESKKKMMNSNKLYKITVEVKKNNEVIEKLLTYKSSLKGSDSN